MVRHRIQHGLRTLVGIGGVLAALGPWNPGVAAAAEPAVPAPPSDAGEPTAEPRFAILDVGAERDAAFLTAIADHGRSVQLELRVVATGGEGPLSQAIAAGKEPGTTGVFWLGHRADGLAIYLYDPRNQGVYIRELARAEGESDAALVESVGLIIASTAVALRERGELGMREVDAQELAALQPEETPSKTEEPPPKTEETPTKTEEPPPKTDEPPPLAYPQLRLGVAYLGDGFNRDAPWQSGVRGQISAVVHPRVRIGVGYGFLAPAQVSDAPALTLTRHELALSLGFGGSLSPRVSLHGVIFGAADLMRWQGPLGTGLRPLARVGPMLEVGIALVRGLSLDLGLGAAFSLNRFAFVVCEDETQPCTGENREVAARPWPVAPRATAGLSYTFERRAKR